MLSSASFHSDPPSQSLPYLTKTEVERRSSKGEMLAVYNGLVVNLSRLGREIPSLHGVCAKWFKPQDHCVVFDKLRELGVTPSLLEEYSKGHYQEVSYFLQV